MNAYLRNLLSEKDVYDMSPGGNGTLLAKSTYAYDNYSAMGNMENYGGNYSGGSAPPGYNAAYNNQNLTIRGNRTGKTDYSDVVNGIAETFNNKRDIFGNTVQEQLACCSLNTYTFTSSTYWTRPDQIIKGDPNGIHVTKLITYDFNTEEKTAVTDPNNLQTTFAYDNSGRPTQTSYPTGASSTAGYNDAAMSTQKSITFTTGGSNASVNTTETVDGWGRSVQSVNSFGGQVNTTYDPMNRVTARTNPFPVGGSPSATTTFIYDPLGRPLTVTLPDGNTTQTTYSGSTTTSTDQVGRKSQSQQDGLGRLISVTEQDSTGGLTLTTNYCYDLLDNLTQVNQGGQIRAFKYDALSRKIIERLPEQAATINDGTGTMWSRRYTYTGFDKVSTRTDARGVVTTYGFDSLSRLTSISYNTSAAPSVASTNNVTFTYDTSGTGTTQALLLSVSLTGPLPTYQETFSYDNLERVSSRTWTRDGQSFTISYQYNTGNELTQITYPDLRVVATNYNGSGQVASVTEPSSGAAYLSSVSYNVAGQMTGMTLGNGVTETFTYDPNRLQLTQQKAVTSGNTTLTKLNYSYQAAAGQMGAGTTAGNAGQLMAINNSSTINGSAESATYTYDLERRLVTSTQTSNGASAQREFVYDRWGNRREVLDPANGGEQVQSVTLEQSGGVPTNRITSVADPKGNTLNYTYDANGNLISDGVHSYQYDAENRISTVDNGNTAAYAYDYMNRRFKKTVGPSVTYYIWDNGRVLAESGASSKDYVYAANLMLGTGSGNALGSNGSFTYFLGDQLSTRVLTDRYGNYLGRQAHLPFGEDFAESGAQDKHHLTTYERDSEVSLDYAFNRQYQFGLGRFMSADPISDTSFQAAATGCSGKRDQINTGNPGSLNLYAYTANDPINSKDLEGLETESVCRTFSITTSSAIATFLTGGFDFGDDFTGGSAGGGGPDFGDLATLFMTTCIITTQLPARVNDIIWIHAQNNSSFDVTISVWGWRDTSAPYTYPDHQGRDYSYATLTPGRFWTFLGGPLVVRNPGTSVGQTRWCHCFSCAECLDHGAPNCMCKYYDNGSTQHNTVTIVNGHIRR
jgi:RHS repeat-associated protein